MSTISELQLLTVLSQEMNMRKAAERLFVTQPALSQRLQNIEKDWGTPLFIRSQRGLSYCRRRISNEICKGNFKKEEEVKESIHAFKEEVYGTLKIAVASIVGQNWLPEVLKRFVERYPQAKVSLVTGWSSDMMKSVSEDNMHIGIIRGVSDWKGIKIHLFDDPLYLVDREIAQLEDIALTDRPFIQFKSDSNYYEEIQVWWHQNLQMPPKNTIVVDQIETCKQLSFNGIGYSILPSIALRKADEALSRIPLFNDNNKPITRGTWLIGYEANFQLKQVQAFLEIVNEYLEEEKVKAINP